MSGVFFGDSLVPNFGQLVVNVLAVAGGALVAGLLVGWLTQLLARTTTTRRVPRPALNLVRLTGAVAGGILVYLFVFGSGGPGYGLGGGGWGLGGKGGTGEQTGPSGTGTTTQPTVPKQPVTAAGEPAVRRQSLRIEMLGGKRYPGDERFYLLDDRKEPQALFDVRRAIEERKRQSPPLKEVEIVILPEGSVAREHPAVTRLVEVIRDLGLGVKVSTPGSEG